MTGGILIRVTSAAELQSVRQNFLGNAARLGIEQYVEAIEERNEPAIRFRLRAEARQKLAPACDTLQLCEKLGLHTRDQPG